MILDSSKAPAAFWKVVANQRSFLDSLAKNLNITKGSEGWYKITYQILKKNGGGRLLREYNGSPSKLLSSVYPEYPEKQCFIYLYDTSGISRNLGMFHVIIGTTFPINGRSWTILQRNYASAIRKDGTKSRVAPWYIMEQEDWLKNTITHQAN